MTVKNGSSAIGRVVHWVLALLGLAVLAFTLVVLYAFNSHWFPRLDLPSFDERKAALLTPAKRAAYEHELFSELDLWNRGGTTYSLCWPMRRLEQLAEKGDVGAMCLMFALVNKAAVVEDWKPRMHQTRTRRLT